MKHLGKENVAESHGKPVSKKKSAPNGSGRSRKLLHELVTIVIVVIPIAIGMPAVAVFVPPTMPLIPAVFPRFMQVVARVIGLPAVPAVMLYGFVESVIRLGDTPLAGIVTFGRCPRCSGECQHANKCCSSEYCLSEKLFLSRVKLHVPSNLPKYPPTGMGSAVP